MKFSVFILSLFIMILVSCGGADNNDPIKIEDGSDKSSSTIVKSKVINPGSTCETGGVEIASGVDSDGNGKLEGSEIIETQIVCHGQSGYDSLVLISDVSAGENCANAGKSISIGKDLNRNSVLDEGESTDIQYVCNGQNGLNGGVDGKDGADGKDGVDGKDGADGKDGVDGADGKNGIDGSGGSSGSGSVSCSIKDGANGSKILECADGSVVPVQGGIVYQSTTVIPIDGGFQIVDSWESSGGRNRYSFKNMHYTFAVNSDSDISISIESGVDNYLYLVDELGFIVKELSGNTISQTVEAGIYKLVAATYSADQKSNYVVNIIGDAGNIGKISSNKKTIVDKWESSGGRLKESYRNKHYDVVFEQDSYININIKTSVSNYIYVINSLGFVIEEVSGNALFVEVPADSYRIVIATYSVGDDSNFVVDVVGQFNSSSLVEKTSSLLQETGAWVLSGGRDRFSSKNLTYSFDITEESLIDITIVSSVSNYLYLVNDLGLVVSEISGDRLTKLIPAGSYQLIVATYSVDQTSNFVLKLYGQVENLLLN